MASTGSGRCCLNASEQRQLGALLDRALVHAGLEVVRPRREAGNLVDHVPVAGLDVVAALLATKGWVTRPRLGVPRQQADVEATPAGRALRLVRDGPEVAR